MAYEQDQKGFDAGYATAQQIEDIYTITHEWFIDPRHAPLIQRPDREIIGEHNGISIVRSYVPQFEFPIDPAAVKEYSPMTARIFEIDNVQPVIIGHSGPTYVVCDDIVGRELELIEPNVSFCFDKSRSSHLRQETLRILSNVAMGGMCSFMRHQTLAGGITETLTPISPGALDSLTIGEFRAIDSLLKMLEQ